MMIALRSDHDIDHRCAADDLSAFRLRNAAGDGDGHLAAVLSCRILGFAQPAKFRVDLLGSLLANVAGVEDHEIRVIRVRRLDKAFRRQRVHHALRIVDIHLTAV